MPRFLLILPFLALAAYGCGDDGPTPPPPTPVAAFTVAGTMQAGQALAFDASASTDPDGAGLSYTWDFGDGTHGGAEQVAHLYAAAGAYAVRLTIRDGAGVTATQTQTVTVAAGPAPTGTATVSGLITLPDGSPLAGVTLAAAGIAATAQTAADGSVTLAGVTAGVPLVLRLTRAGYTSRIVRLDALAAGSTDGYFQAALKPRAAAVTLANAQNGGTVTGASGSQLVLPAGSLVRADGSAVTGAVDVAITPVDVTTEIEAFPGDFTGIEADGTSWPIASFGLAEIEVSQAGQPLQIAPGYTATLDLPVYTGGTAAGQTIPVWSLDERIGLWVQEGTGTVVASAASPTGLVLRSEVSHLSWWNADQKFPPFTVNVKCFTLDLGGNPVPLTTPCWVWVTPVGSGLPVSSGVRSIPGGTRGPLLLRGGVALQLHGGASNGAVGAIPISGPSGTSVNVDLVLTGVGPTIGPVVLVAVGSGVGPVTVSDGVSWVAPFTPMIGGVGEAVEWNGSLWLVGGSGIMTSPDGLAWTASPSAGAIFQTVTDVAWNGSMWVAVGANNLGFALATSQDGQSWTQRTVPSIPQRGEAVAWNGQTWIAGGTLFGGVVRSSDGITWSFVPGPITTMLALAVDGPGWIAVGWDANGAEVVGRSHDDGDNWGTGPLSQVVPMSLAYNGSIWLTGGPGGVSISNDGGIIWMPWSTSMSTGGLAWTGTEWVAVGADGNGAGQVITSPDAYSWSLPVPLPHDGRDVAFKRPIYPPWP